MKVLMVYDEAHADNLFVSVLCKAIRQQNIKVKCSCQEFWESNINYDIIHFQWPEEVIGWNCHTQDLIVKLKQRIEYYQKQGAYFIYTRHNQCPHYTNNIISEAYTLIESYADSIVHMGEYSYIELIKKYPQKQHWIIPHHIYENTYNENISCLEARERLKIPQKSFVITAFGKFRKIEEFRLVFAAYVCSGIHHKYLLAPRFYPFSRHKQKNILRQICFWLIWHIAIPFTNKIFNIQGDSNEKIISNNDLPYYLAASDLIIIQRKQILNSGNVPLAFLFRKVVVGPDCGNVGELLKKTNNPVFLPQKYKTIKKALRKGYILSKNHQGEVNYKYALQNMNLDKIGKMYIEVYRKTSHLNNSMDKHTI